MGNPWEFHIGNSRVGVSLSQCHKWDLLSPPAKKLYDLNSFYLQENFTFFWINP